MLCAATFIASSPRRIASNFTRWYSLVPPAAPPASAYSTAEPCDASPFKYVARRSRPPDWFDVHPHGVSQLAVSPLTTSIALVPCLAVAPAPRSHPIVETNATQRHREHRDKTNGLTTKARRREAVPNMRALLRTLASSCFSR